MLQICAMGAVGIFRGRYPEDCPAGVLPVCDQPLFGLGTLYQLIAQVGGIAILLAALRHPAQRPRMHLAARAASPH